MIGLKVIGGFVRLRKLLLGMAALVAVLSAGAQSGTCAARQNRANAVQSIFSQPSCGPIAPKGSVELRRAKDKDLLGRVGVISSDSEGRSVVQQLANLRASLSPW